MKRWQKMGRALPPASFGQNPKEQQVFLGKPSLTEIHLSILINPFYYLKKYMYQFLQIHLTTKKNPCNNFDKSTIWTNSTKALSYWVTRQGNDLTLDKNVWGRSLHFLTSIWISEGCKPASFIWLFDSVTTTKFWDVRLRKYCNFRSFYPLCVYQNCPNRVLDWTVKVRNEIQNSSLFSCMIVWNASFHN